MLSPEHASLIDVATPALVVDADAVRDNVARMATAAKAAGVSLRPHAKTHKTRQVAELQIAAGAAGICCATVTEAEALSEAGIRNLLITSPTYGADKFARVAALNRKYGIMVVADHVHQLEGLQLAIPPDDPPLWVLVDTDVGQLRTGVTDWHQGVSLAKSIAELSRLRFAGIQAYAGHAQHIEAADARQTKVAEVAAQVRRLVDALQGEGLAPRLVTGSGTGTFMMDAAGPFNELQVGSYVFMDAEYARVVDAQGKPPEFLPALFVLATVISVNRPGQVTVDAGTKVLATNGPPPDVLIGAPEGSTYRFGGDEHGMITIPAGQRAPAMGDRILIRATHCDPTVNLHGVMHAVSDSSVERWSVLGRHSAA